MPPPNDYTLPTGVEAHRLPNGSHSLSDALVKLLKEARSAYDWPGGTGAAQSQQTIMDIEADVVGRMQALDKRNAHQIVMNVSQWAHNRRHNAIVQATPEAKVQMLNSLKLLNSPSGRLNAIDGLCSLPGIRLVIASKIFGFCCPAVGAAVDRHTSYFFNSLEIIFAEGHRGGATNFRREWSNGPNSPSRLATYTTTGYNQNRNEFFSVYLSLLDSVTETLNSMSALYQCAATGEQRNWRPTDVDMAAYYWGAVNGAR